MLLTKPIHAEKTANTLVLSKADKLVVIKGLENFIIVDTDDCLMIYPKDEEQNIKSLKDDLKSKGLDQYL